MAVAALAVLLAGVASEWAYQARVGKFQRDFVGWSEARVISALGPPWYDSRQPNAGGSSDYTLGWYYFLGSQLGLEFKDGKVHRQWHGSK